MLSLEILLDLRIVIFRLQTMLQDRIVAQCFFKSLGCINTEQLSASHVVLIK